MIAYLSDRGLTLVEVLVALALLLLALAMFSGVLVVSQRSATRQMEQGQTLNQLRQAVTGLDAELRSGFIAKATASPPSVTIYTEAYGAPLCVTWSLAKAGLATLLRTTRVPGGQVSQGLSLASGIQNHALGKDALTFTVKNDPILKVGRALGVRFWVLAAGSSPGQVPTEFATTLEARNVSLSALKNGQGVVISSAC